MSWQSQRTIVISIYSNSISTTASYHSLDVERSLFCEVYIEVSYTNSETLLRHLNYSLWIIKLTVCQHAMPLAICSYQVL